jgi:LPXTG-motif cell wall-anchored protein
MNKRVDTSLTILLIVALFALSSGYDFWRGYHYRHSVEDGVIFTILGFVVLGLIAVVLLLRRK